MPFSDSELAKLDSRQPQTRMVDLKVGLPWLLSTATGLIVAIASLAWSVGQVVNRIENMAGAVGKLEATVTDRDQRLERMQTEVQGNRLLNEIQNQRLSVLEDHMRRTAAK